MSKRVKKTLITLGVLLCGIGCFFFVQEWKTKKEDADYYTKKFMEALAPTNEVAFNVKALDASNQQELRSKYGDFIVVVKNKSEFFDGYKITFSIYNKSKITLPKPRMKLRWGSLRKQFHMYNILEIPKDCFVAFGERCNKYDADWIKSFKEKTFDKLEDLRGESWTDVVFYILPCEEKHCEQIELTLLD